MGGKGGQSSPDSEKFAKNRENEGGIGEKREKLGKKRKNQEEKAKTQKVL